MTTETDDLVRRLVALSRHEHDDHFVALEAADTIERLQREHCKDCCCAQSWRALGVTEYTGMSIPEHIERLQRDLQECVELLVAWREFFDERRGIAPTASTRALLARLKEKP